MCDEVVSTHLMKIYNSVVIECVARGVVKWARQRKRESLRSIFMAHSTEHDKILYFSKMRQSSK